MNSKILHDGGGYAVIVNDRLLSTHETYGAAERALNHELDMRIAAGKVKFSGFSGMPNKGEPITGPIQVYEDKFPRG